MMAHGQPTNFYEILEVAPNAAQHEIHRAYQRAKETYSQENPALYTMFSPQEAQELLRMIEEAYSVLGNHALRRTYDESLLRGESKAPQPVAVTAQPSSLASAHQALPDFGTPEHPDDFTMKTRDVVGRSTLPPGMGRTTLSTYTLDESLEREIADATEFDGELLRKVRNYKGISLERLSEATRVSRTYLSAVENNDYKTLPAAVFVRGFVVQMARLLGLNENKVAASYMKNFKAGGGK
jgi:curved DNA-binding protein CbpA